MIKPLFLPIALCAAILSPRAAQAGPTAEALSSCMTDSSTGKDRKELARWIFVAMSSHPELKGLTTITPADQETSDKDVARLATRLLTESCSKQAQAAMSAEGNAALEAAFGMLGQLAMQELMADAGVKVSFSNYTKYLDRARFEAVFSKK
ncbi:hypothetical protein [Ideonella dechloratans]|uniref:hypothetical protein n=1 Tax=Ideonella dechloratans TaxID=36863 RepID=UPI0035B29D78